MSARKKAILQLIIASILWSTGGILIKLIDWNPVAIAGSRSLISGLVILFYLKRPKITLSKAQGIGALAYFFAAQRARHQRDSRREGALYTNQFRQQIEQQYDLYPSATGS